MMTAQTPEGKQCRSCGIIKPLSDFSPHATGRLGRTPRCKECNNAARRKKYAENPEIRSRTLQRRRQRYDNDPEFRERIRISSLLWKRHNKALVRKYIREYRERNPTKTKAANDRRLHTPQYFANQEVRKAVSRGDLPPASAMVCELCQEAQAQHYHHWHGYSLECQLDVIAVCLDCHGDQHTKDKRQPITNAIRLHEESRLSGMGNERN